MNKELEIWQFAAERLKRNESAVLLVVVESSGSSPGRQGFKMLVAADETRGSIGGGVMEMRLVEQARELIKSDTRNPQSEVVAQVHRKNSPDASGMICSGKQTIVFFKLTPEHYELIKKIPDYLKNPRGRRLRITPNELLLTKEENSRFDYKFEMRGENEFSYEEKLGCKNTLYIVGGGHCALALSELMSKMDFYIELFDDRPNLDTLAKNGFVNAKIVLENYELIADFIASGANVYVVVMTLGYKSDETVIRKLINKNFKYFGVLGSRAKMKTLLRNLEKENYPKEKLNRIHTPIGLQINSRTPEEIAVSIAAEIISIKNEIL